MWIAEVVIAYSITYYFKLLSNLATKWNFEIPAKVCIIRIILKIKQWLLVSGYSVARLFSFFYVLITFRHFESLAIRKRDPWCVAQLISSSNLKVIDTRNNERLLNIVFTFMMVAHSFHTRNEYETGSSLERIRTQCVTALKRGECGRPSELVTFVLCSDTC